MSEPTKSAGELYRAHARYVAGFLVRLGAPDADVEDLTQEVFLVAHRRGGFAPGEARPTTWLAEIAVRVWSNRRRTARRRPGDAPGEASPELERATSDPERDVATKRALERVQRCLDDLDLDHRAVFVLYELDGEKCAAIAAALGVPVGTVYRRLHTARERFRARWAELSAEGGDER